MTFSKKFFRLCSPALLENPRNEFIILIPAVDLKRDLKVDQGQTKKQNKWRQQGVRVRWREREGGERERERDRERKKERKRERATSSEKK